MNIESELKFSLDPEQTRKLLKSRAIRHAAEGQSRHRHLVSTYFDSPQHVLRKSGAALRVRRSGEDHEQTVKLPAAGPIGMQNYEEWNLPLPSAEPDLAGIDRRLLRRLSRRGHRLRVLPVFTTDMQRTTRQLARGKTRFEMALDVGRIHGHGRAPAECPVCEVEFELQRGDALPLLDFILELSDEVDLRPLYQTKAERGYALARSALRAGRDKARPVTLDAGMSVGEAFRCIVGEALRHLQANLQPTLDGQPGGVHQARVAIRRIRAALRAFKRVLPYDKRKAFNGEFRWFQSRLAPARDWHVFLKESLPQVTGGGEADQAARERLRKLALRERRRATAEAQEVFHSQRFTRLVLQFQRWLLALETENRGMFDLPLRPFAASVLDKTRRDLLLDTRPLSRMSEEDRHGLRKRGKKARYAMEFFSGLWSGPRVKHYLKLMETMQDRLGEANDAVVARMLMASLPPRTFRPASLLLVQEWSQRRELECNRAGQPVWRKMQRTAPFWAGPDDRESPAA